METEFNPVALAKDAKPLLMTRLLPLPCKINLKMKVYILFKGFNNIQIRVSFET